MSNTATREIYSQIHFHQFSAFEIEFNFVLDKLQVIDATEITKLFKTKPLAIVILILHLKAWGLFEDYEFYYAIGLFSLYGRILIHNRNCDKSRGSSPNPFKGWPGTWLRSVPRHAALILLLSGYINNGQRYFASRKRHFKHWKNRAYSRINMHDNNAECRRKEAYRKESYEKLTKDRNESNMKKYQKRKSMGDKRHDDMTKIKTENHSLWPTDAKPKC